MDPVQQQAAVNKVLEELVRVLPRKVEMGHKDLFPTWEAFLDTFTRVGGVIEAVPPAAVDSPSVNLLIDPTGEVSVHSTHDHMFTADYHYVGATFPQQTANRRALNGASLAVGKVCAEKGIIGYVSVDFVSFRDSDGQQRLWAIDLNIGVHDTAVSFEMFRFLTNGHFNPNLGTYYADVQGGGRGGGSQPVGAGAGVQGEEGGDDDGGVRCYAVSDMTYHPNLATVQYNVFFNLCRLKGVHFDLEDKLGTGARRPPRPAPTQSHLPPPTASLSALPLPSLHISSFAHHAQACCVVMYVCLLWCGVCRVHGQPSCSSTPSPLESLVCYAFPIQASVAFAS